LDIWHEASIYFVYELVKKNKLILQGGIVRGLLLMKLLKTLIYIWMAFKFVLGPSKL
jgi:hypothetical protein